MAKKNNDYFELLKKQTSYCVEASALLSEIISSYNAENMDDYRERMHSLEHTADGVHHDILNKLSTEFITPIDQEDILRLVQIVDDITDALDEVVLDLYMYNITLIPEKTHELTKEVGKCVGLLHEAVSELKSFKKPEKLRELLIKVNDTETEADGVYTEAIRSLFTSNADGKTLLGAKAVYESLENCCDLCEHASEVIEQVIIKNT